MKLWLLRPSQDLAADDDPWEPWYDKAFGFVVRAETEDEARGIAHANAGDENRGEFLGKATASTKQPWIDPKYSMCDELVANGSAGVLMRDFASA